MDFTCRYTLLKNSTQNNIDYGGDENYENCVKGFLLKEGDEEVDHEYVLYKEVDCL